MSFHVPRTGEDRPNDRLTGGNVGIGTSTPSAKLEINGGLKTGGTTVINITDVGTVGQMMVNGTGIFDVTTRGANMRITDDMSVGTDVTVSNNLSVSNTIKTKNLVSKPLSGTGVLYLKLVDANGNEYKSATVWNQGH